MKKKIIISGLNPKFGGGITNLTLSFLKFFSNDYDIKFFYPYTKKKKVNFILPNIYSKEFFKIPRFSRALQSFFLSFKSLKSDINIAIGGTSFEALPFYLKKIPYFLWTATTLKSEKSTQNISVSKFDLNLEKKLYRNAIKIFTISNSSKNEIEIITGRKDIILLPPPIHEEFLNLNRIKTKDKFILFTGRLNDKRKNVEFLLKIFKKYLHIN